MGLEEKLGDMKHFDDYYSAIKGEARYKKAKAAIEAVSKFEDRISDFYTAVIKPAHDEFAKVLDDNLKKIKGDTKGKEKELKKAFVEALKAFFKKAMPSVLDGIKDIKDEEELYKVLTFKYDSLMTGYGDLHRNPTLQGAAEGYSAAKGVSISKARKEMDQKIGDMKLQNESYLRDHYKTISLSHFHPGEISSAVMDEAKQRGWEITEHGQWHAHHPKEHYQAYRGVTKGEWGIHPETKQPLKPKEHYGLTQKK